MILKVGDRVVHTQYPDTRGTVVDLDWAVHVRWDGGQEPDNHPNAAGLPECTSVHIPSALLKVACK